MLTISAPNVTKTKRRTTIEGLRLVSAVRYVTRRILRDPLPLVTKTQGELCKLHQCPVERQDGYRVGRNFGRATRPVTMPGDKPCKLPQRRYGTYLTGRSRRFVGFVLCLNVQRSDKLDVLSSRTLWALSFGVRNSLPLAKLLVTHAFQTRLMEKHVLGCARVDKSEALVRQPLDRAFSHFRPIPQKCRYGFAWSPCAQNRPQKWHYTAQTVYSNGK